jgi:hypothetical protein
LVWTTDYGRNATEKRAFDFNDLQDNYRKLYFPVVFYLPGLHRKTLAKMAKLVAQMPLDIYKLKFNKIAIFPSAII